MEQIDLQVMLKDGSFNDYVVKTERDSKRFLVYQGEQHVITIEAKEDGSMTSVDNPANIDEDLETRIKEQLKGLQT